MATSQRLRDWLRGQPWWLALREAKREGYRNAWLRNAYQRRILKTPPARTGAAGPVEVRVLTWRRDWINLIWALKSFYHFAQVDYPLVIHDGGLLPRQTEALRHHFPDASLVTIPEGNARIAQEFHRRGLRRCLDYRERNPSTRKLFDFFAFSRAETLLVIDSDIVFFRRPDLLLPADPAIPVNLYNRDVDHQYSMSLDELEAAFGVRPPERINSGLALVRRETIDFDQIDQWLAHPKLFEDRWVTEQTLHALCSTLHGVDLLPDDQYVVGVEPGLPAGLACKHYPGYFRTLLYQEGMAELTRTGFLSALRRSAGVPSPAPLRAS